FFIISLLIVLIYGTINIPTLLVTLIVVFIISMLFGIRKAGTIKFNLVEGAVSYRLWLNFSLSMLIMNLLNSFDKFLIEYKLSRADLGDYFFLQNIFLSPFSQIQTYAGFKLLALYK